MNKSQLYIITLIIASITAISLFIPYQESTIVQWFRVIFGSIFILFLPGYYLTLSFFNTKEIDILERGALSFALSISVIPLMSFYLNLIGLKINEFSVFMITLGIILLNIAYLHYQKQGQKI